ncbi:hypothetical protein K438DRAFT_1782683 [Mycena galopus ATCC 62051]|nr:hypothetical protein K438DRAFT_1782683 [Mycena galopus ATCC 62051]
MFIGLLTSISASPHIGDYIKFLQLQVDSLDVGSQNSGAVQLAQPQLYSYLFLPASILCIRMGFPPDKRHCEDDEPGRFNLGLLLSGVVPIDESHTGVAKPQGSFNGLITITTLKIETDGQEYLTYILDNRLGLSVENTCLAIESFNDGTFGIYIPAAFGCSFR